MWPFRNKRYEEERNARIDAEARAGYAAHFGRTLDGDILANVDELPADVSRHFWRVVNGEVDHPRGFHAAVRQAQNDKYLSDREQAAITALLNSLLSDTRFQ